MGSSYSIPTNDFDALMRGYEFLIKNQARYDPDFVSEVSLMYTSTMPEEPAYSIGFFDGSRAGTYIPVSKDQYQTYKKLRELLHNPKVKKIELTPSQQVLQIVSALDN